MEKGVRTRREKGHLKDRRWVLEVIRERGILQQLLLYRPKGVIGLRDGHTQANARGKCDWPKGT